MRTESSVTSISWIPSEAARGMTKLPFETAVSHYDPPPPDVLDKLRREGSVRTSTLRTVTAVKVTAAVAAQIEPAVLAEVSQGHRREEG